LKVAGFMLLKTKNYLSAPNPQYEQNAMADIADPVCSAGIDGL
jgi:hypothetical protein